MKMPKWKQSIKCNKCGSEMVQESIYIRGREFSRISCLECDLLPDLTLSQKVDVTREMLSKYRDNAEWILIENFEDYLDDL